MRILLVLLLSGCVTEGRSYMIPAKGSANCIKKYPDGSVVLDICPVKAPKKAIET